MTISTRSVRPLAVNSSSPTQAPVPAAKANPVTSAPVDLFESQGPSSAQNGPLPAPLPKTPIEVLYTDPFHHDKLGDRFVELLDGATQSVDGAFFEILDDRILGGFERAAQRGVAVHLITDDNYFQVSDTQEGLDRNVSVLSQVHELDKDIKQLRTTQPDFQTKAQALLDTLPALEKTVNESGIPEEIKPDLIPLRDYLSALAKGDVDGAEELKKDFYSMASSVSSRLGDNKVRQQFRPAYDRLLRAGVEIKDDGASALTHDKYMVLDGETTFVGSYNLQGLKSSGGDHVGMYRTADNAMVVHSEDVAKSFLNDFSQMFDDGLFHGDKHEVDAQMVRVNGVKVTPFFAPKDPLEANIAADLGNLLTRMRAANAAGHPLSPPPKIRLAGFAMSYNGTEAMVDMLSLLHKEGADVQVVADALSAGSASSSVKALRAHGVPVLVTDAEVMMHDKFLMVQAGRTNFVYSGSANFTHPAYFDNDEAVLKVESLPMTRAYDAMFESLRDDVKDPTGLEDLAADGLSEKPVELPPGTVGDPVIDAGTGEPAWMKIDPSTIQTLEDAQQYALLRWGA
jgi:phosphatidylserine/phosphatidylglycerophosphate/cardiolipin synthase-like enzyme